MTLNKDIFLRSHVVEVDPKEPPVSDYNEPKWPEYALVFDTETTLDPKDQSLLFGFYRVCRLQGNAYHCVEEGILYADDLTSEYQKVISRYKRAVSSEVVHEDYDARIHVYSRSDFIEKIFFYAIKQRALIIAFNAPWDVSRLAVQYRVSNNRAWTLILSQREFDPTKLKKKWLKRKWKTTKDGHLKTHAGYYTVVIKQRGTAYRASVFTNGRSSVGNWKPTTDKAKLDGLRLLSEDVAAAKQSGPVLEPNPERPCMRVTSKDSKAAFFSLTKPLRPEEWPTQSSFVMITPTIFSSETATHAKGQSSSLNSSGTGFGAKMSLNVSLATVSIRICTEPYSLAWGLLITRSLSICVF